MVEEADRLNRKEGGGGNGEGDFTYGMLGWRYFSEATSGYPASAKLKTNTFEFLP